MIYSSIFAQDNYAKYPEAIQRALSYIAGKNFASMAPGEYPIVGDQIFAKVFDITSKPVSEIKPEIHRKYIDLQFWPCGEEKVGIAPAIGTVGGIESHEDSDLYYCKEPENESFINAREGDFLILFTNDIHRPGIAMRSPISYRKVVVKILQSLVSE